MPDFNTNLASDGGRGNDQVLARLQEHYHITVDILQRMRRSNDVMFGTQPTPCSDDGSEKVSPAPDGFIAKIDEILVRINQTHQAIDSELQRMERFA